MIQSQPANAIALSGSDSATLALRAREDTLAEIAAREKIASKKDSAIGYSARAETARKYDEEAEAEIEKRRVNDSIAYEMIYGNDKEDQEAERRRENKREAAATKSLERKKQKEEESQARDAALQSRTKQGNGAPQGTGTKDKDRDGWCAHNYTSAACKD